MNKQIIEMHSVITALSCALDLVGVDESRHGKRVAMIAKKIAEHLHWPTSACTAILHAGMLHDCGVSKIHEHHLLTETLEWDGAEAHCIRGAEYLSACEPVAHLATEIRYHHTRWEILLKSNLDETTRVRANLLYLADRIDVLQAPYLSNCIILAEYPSIIARINSLAGTMFAPELVQAFTEIADSEAFWLAMEPEYLDEDIQEIGRYIPAVPLDMDAIKALARLFSRTVDAKSHFTHEHSLRVAQIAKHLASELGIKGIELEQVEIAGLLHDLGKLRVSEDIIDKPGKLTLAERTVMNRHSYDTYRILQRVFYDSKIPVWAGFHHETLSGSGYPFKTGPQGLDLECRIIAVADIFQALAQARPYRPSMGLPSILENLRLRVAEGRLDGKVVDTLIAKQDYYFKMANA